MRRLALLLAVTCAFLLVSCGQPLPRERSEYAGEWQGPLTWMVISPSGHIEYERRRDGGKVTINAPIQRFEGDNFVVGVGPFTTTFVVSKPPHFAEGRWRMVVDGVELTRVATFGETRT